MTENYVAGVRLKALPAEGSYLRQLPVVRDLWNRGGLDFRRRVTFLVGENGSGKSTLLEAMAVCAGFNGEGGSRNVRFSTEDTVSPLWESLTLIRRAYPRDGYFLRSESFYNVATYLDELDRTPWCGGALNSYGGVSLHRQSHGESFLSLMENRFGGQGLYLLDEPEAALSPARQLELLALVRQLERKGSQFLIATHSPILMTYPRAEVLELRDEGIRSVDYRQTEHYQLTRRFLEAPERMLRYLFAEE
ncbi:AAA family ATPase [Dysosmobacter sp.]|uniref:AAA family ATPase n=1 Tax=Dysosmobacter sp. TaxID=2591382 RepID=UPI002A88FF39|nr:AAA family ATPase [Dysosmobacter sp.]MDY3282731.1 AAA family ATPase [Dysosmobacter sp.]